MIINMKGKQVFAPLTKSIKIEIDSHLEDKKLKDFINNYLTLFI